MARFHYEGTVTTTKSKQECIDGIKKTLSGLGGKVVSNTAQDTFTSSLGNNMMFRFLGAFLASDSMWPMIANIKLEEDGAGHVLKITVEEDFGFGTLFGVETKFREKVEKRKNTIEEKLSTFLG